MLPLANLRIKMDVEMTPEPKRVYGLLDETRELIDKLAPKIALTMEQRPKPVESVQV